MWIFNNKEYNKIHDDSLVGFVYLITYQDFKTKEVFKYIGKKQFYTVRNQKKGKKELALQTDKRLSKNKILKKESDWKSYQSSNEFLKKQNSKDCKKEILKFCKDLKELSYYETKYQFIYDVLERDDYLNGNILGRFFKLKEKNKK